MRRLCYSSTILIGALNVAHIATQVVVSGANDADLTPVTGNDGQLLVPSGGSQRHRLSEHRKRTSRDLRRRRYLVDSLQNGAAYDIDYDSEIDYDQEINDSGDDDPSQIWQEERHLAQKKKKKVTNNVSSSKNNPNNKKDRKKPSSNTNKKKKNEQAKQQNDRSKQSRDSNNDEKKANKNQDENKKKASNNEDKKDSDKRNDKKEGGKGGWKRNQEWCLCEDIYGPDWERLKDLPTNDWSSSPDYGTDWWEEDDGYDDDYSYEDDDDDHISTTKRKEYKKNKKRKKNGRVLADEEELDSKFSRDVLNRRPRRKSSEELMTEEDPNEEEDVTTLAEMFATASAAKEEEEEEEEEEGTMTLRKKRQNRGNKKNKNSGSSVTQHSWGGGGYNSRSFTRNKFASNGKGGKGATVSRGNKWGGNWNGGWEGGDKWKAKPDIWCPCPYVPKMPTYSPTQMYVPPTFHPTYDPTYMPTNMPTVNPTTVPTDYPTYNPTSSPTMNPTLKQTNRPTPRPTTSRPTTSPSSKPSLSPTISAQPSSQPTPRKGAPTRSPSEKPSMAPLFSATGYEWGEKAGVGGPLGESQTTPVKFRNGFPIIDITAGPRYTLYIDIYGKAYASGYIESLSTYNGQFGVGSNVTQGSNNDRPVKFVFQNGAQADAPPFQSVYAGRDHSAFIDESGRLYTTGSNNDGKLCLGDTGGESRNIPHQVILPRKAVSVALGLEFTLILLDNGEVYGCGSNRLGQLGLGNTVTVSTPTRIGSSLGRIKAISAGAEFSLFLTRVGKAYSTGRNIYMQQCRNNGGTPVKTLTEIQSPKLEVIGIQAGSESSYLLLSNGDNLPAIASCGRNNQGQLCIGSLIDTARKQVKLDGVSVTGFGSGPTAETVFFIGVNTTDGSDVVYGCGRNDLSQLGIGNFQPTQQTTPKKVPFNIKRFNMEISAASSHTVSIDLSLATDSPSQSPSATPSLAYPTSLPSTNPTVAPTPEDPNKCSIEYWGSQRGVGYGDGSQQTPAPLDNGNENTLDISAGPQYTLSVDASNRAFASGFINDLQEYNGRFGVKTENLQQGNNRDKQIETVIYVNEDGSTRTDVAPLFRRVYTGAGGEDIGHSVIMDKGGTLFSTGSNSMGQLCTNAESTFIPRQVRGLPGGLSILGVALGREFTLILLNNGQVYGCGSNRSGQLGLEDLESVSTPTRITGFGTNTANGFGENLVKKISAGQDFSLFQTVDGRIFGSGVNSNLQLCNSNTANIRKPTVLTLENNRPIQAIMAGMISSYFLFDNRHVGACGSNVVGQLGDGSNNAADKVYAAVNIPSSDSIYQINSGPSSQSVFFIALRDTYGAGLNNQYQLGIGNTENRWTPTIVLDKGAQDLYEISSSSSHTTASNCDTNIDPELFPTLSPTNKPTPQPTNKPTPAPTTLAPTPNPTPPPTNPPGQTPPPTPAPTESQNARIPTVTTLEAPSNTDGQAGRSAAILGTRTLIGAPNGNVQGNPLGIAYYISNIDTSPNNFQTIAPNPQSGSGLSGNSFSCGHSVTLSERYVVVGCPKYKRLVGGVYTTNNMGAILINDLNSGISGTTTILSPKPDEVSEYGTSVSINSSGQLAVGTRNVGRVYIHDLNDNNPQNPTNSLGGGGFGSSFGWSVALGDDGTLAVGAIQQNGKGAVYLYRNGNFANSPVTINAPSAVSNGGQFGFSVALDGNTLVVGAPASSVAGRVGAGTAFTYDLSLSDNDLVNQARALNANPNENAEFGRSVSITSGAIVVGSRGYERNDLFPGGQGAVFFYNQNTNGDWYRPVIEANTNPIIGAGSQYADSVAIGETAFLVGIPNLNQAGATKAGAARAYFYTSSTSGISANTAAASSTTRQSTRISRIEEISDKCILAYRFNDDAKTITMALTCKGVVDKWLGVGFSVDGQMQNAEAVLGLPGKMPRKYDLNGKSIDAVVEMPANKQTLIEPSLEVDAEDRTVLRFTKIMNEEDEIEIKQGGEIYLLYALGTSQELGYHAERKSLKVTL